MTEYSEGKDQVYAFGWNENDFIIRLYDKDETAYLRLDTHQLRRFRDNLNDAIDKFVERKEKK